MRMNADVEAEIRDGRGMVVWEDTDGMAMKVCMGMRGCGNEGVEYGRMTGVKMHAWKRM